MSRVSIGIRVRISRGRENPVSCSRMKEFARGARAAAAHGEEIEAEIGTADRFGAGGAGHRLGEQHCSARGQRAVHGTQDFSRGIVVVVVDDAHQRGDIGAFGQCIDAEIAAEGFGAGRESGSREVGRGRARRPAAGRTAAGADFSRAVPWRPGNCRRRRRHRAGSGGGSCGRRRAPRRRSLAGMPPSGAYRPRPARRAGRRGGRRRHRAGTPRARSAPRRAGGRRGRGDRRTARCGVRPWRRCQGCRPWWRRAVRGDSGRRAAPPGAGRWRLPAGARWRRPRATGAVPVRRRCAAPRRGFRTIAVARRPAAPGCRQSRRRDRTARGRAAAQSAGSAENWPPTAETPGC